MKIKTVSIFKVAFYFCIIWDTLLLSIFNLQVGDKRYSIMVALALAFTALILTNRNRISVMGQSLKWPKKYLFIVCIMLLVHIVYAVVINGVSLGIFAHNAFYYLMCAWAIPLIYIMKKDDGTEKFWNFINIIMFAWYSWLLLEFVAYQFGGIVLSQAILNSESGIRIRNDTIRLEMKALAHVAIIYNFDKFYNQKERKHRAVHLAMALYGISTMLIVEQTRGYYIAVFGALAILIMCYNKKQSNSSLLD